MTVNLNGAYQASLTFPSIRHPTSCTTLLQRKNASKQLLRQLTERQFSQRTEWITAHACVWPFSCFSYRVWGFTWRNQYLPSRLLVWLFVIQWSSIEVNGTKQVSGCVVCLCRAESLIYRSEDVYRLQFQDYKYFLLAWTVALVGLIRARRHLLNSGFHVFPRPQEAVTNCICQNTSEQSVCSLKEFQKLLDGM